MKLIGFRESIKKIGFVIQYVYSPLQNECHVKLVFDTFKRILTKNLRLACFIFVFLHLKKRGLAADLHAHLFRNLLLSGIRFLGSHVTTEPSCENR